MNTMSEPDSLRETPLNGTNRVSPPVITGFLEMIPTFSNTSSDSMNIRQFFQTVDSVARIARWDPEVKIVILQAKLKGRPLSTFFSLQDLYPHSFDDVKDNLIKCYDRAEFQEKSALDQLLGIRQLREEKVCDYAIRLYTMFNRAVSKNNQVSLLRDNVVMKRFIKGLHPQLREHVLHGEPKTLNEAIDIAERKEKVGNESGNLGNNRTISVIQNPKNECGDKVENASAEAEKNDRLARLEAAVSSLCESVAQLAENIHAGQRIKQSGSRRCFICNDPNHLASKCPKRKPSNLN
ncbi:uncharacterized protein LOC111637952 [Centruroides sculpturatus]|uniref:uncharacterized protein LOC111637951 n=1 Tax=Centruroides sculpturatus TaxID=218467 RepID=UPI000C6D16B4|nr:uncharacterized protein LOC111637951 [Centruroides sculpturatus]XP_023239328.1 uncharacterized protein LOC111637952 [Centruroides sculpturatus]